MAIYQKQTESLRGSWVKKEDLRNGMKVKITSETNPEPSAFTDKDGVIKNQDVCLAKFEGQLEPVKVSLNKATIGAMVEAFGEDSKEWIGRELTVEVEKMRVAGKAVLALYMIPDGFYKYDDEDGYAKLGRKKEGAEQELEDLPY